LVDLGGESGEGVWGEGAVGVDHDDDGGGGGVEVTDAVVEGVAFAAVEGVLAFEDGGLGELAGDVGGGVGAVVGDDEDAVVGEKLGGDGGEGGGKACLFVVGGDENGEGGTGFRVRIVCGAAGEEGGEAFEAEDGDRDRDDHGEGVGWDVDPVGQGASGRGVGVLEAK
jgi:hypothetical protein